MGYFGILFGIFTLAGGVIGFLKAGSMVSLAAGGLFGLGILVSAIFYLKQAAWSFPGLFILSMILAVFFGFRYAETQAMMPAGMMVILSLVNLVGLLIQRNQKGQPQA